MASDPSLVQYIRKQVNAGFSKEQVYQAVLAAGWAKEQINEAIYEIMGKRPEAKPSPEKIQSPAESPSKSHTVRNVLVTVFVLVILIGILFFLFMGPALFALGVFSPSTYTGHQATGFGELGMPRDWQYSGTTLTIFLGNQASQNIEISGVSSSSCNPYTTGTTIPAGGTAQVTLYGCSQKSAGTSYSQPVTVQYSIADGLTKPASGTLTGIAV